MSEDKDKSSNAKPESAPSMPKAPRLNPEGGDIVGAAPERKERSAVVGQVEPSSSGSGPSGGYRGQRGGGQHSGQRGGGQHRGRRDGGQRGQRQEEVDDGLFEKVVHINRCAKVVAGGRRFSFSALVVVGDTNGKVGVGYGKAKEVPECIRKGTEQAKKNMRSFQLKNNTIPHETVGNHDGGRILLRPAVPGTGVIAGGGVRAVLEAAGVKDVLTKSLRSNTPSAMVFATLDALKQLRSAETIREILAAEAE